MKANGASGVRGHWGLVAGASMALVVLVALGVLVSLLAHAGVFGSSAAGAVSTTGTGVALSGTDMRRHPAPAFSLLDQNGATVSLSSLRGRVVVLTFLDATCTQQCPIMVQYLNQTTQFLTPQQVSQVAWVAISVNANNTPAQATAFLAKNQAAMNMRFLLGSQAQLQPLWKGYYIAAQPGLSDVTHTSGLYLIDQQGREREWLDAGFDPKGLATDVQKVLGSASQ